MIVLSLAAWRNPAKPQAASHSEDSAVRKWLTALIWIVILALGTGGSEFYKTLRHPKKLDDRVAEYDQAWADALKQVAAAAPPDVDT